MDYRSHKSKIQNTKSDNWCNCKINWYFLSGDEKIKPMILKDITEKTQMDISTILELQIANTLKTPYGVFW